MSRKRLLKQFFTIFLLLCIIITEPFSMRFNTFADIAEDDYYNEMDGDKEPLGSTDNIFQIKIFSAKAKGAYDGNFFKKNNFLYIDKESILNMADFKVDEGTNGRLIKITRKDDSGLYFKVSDYETVTFEDVTYYPFIEAMNELCINMIYDDDLNGIRVIPAKNVEPLMDMFYEIYDSDIYNMGSWRDAQYLDADMSRAVAQSVTIARGFFSLPEVAYDYLSGNMDYESYRVALYKILLNKVSCDVVDLDDFKEEKNFLEMLESNQELFESLEKSKKLPTTGAFWGKAKGASKLAGGIAGLINDADTILQTEDTLDAVNFYYNIDNMNESVVNGIELINTSWTSENKNFKEALDDTVKFNNGEKSLADMILAEMNDGMIKLGAGEIDYGVCTSLGEFGVSITDEIGEYIAEEFFGSSYAPDQLEGIMIVTANLEIQDAAIKAYKYYKAIYESTNDVSKKMLALNNMKDVTLVYMIAGHNAWMSMEFEESMKTAVDMNVSDMSICIENLLDYGEEDFCVYQNVINTKHKIFMNYDNREQTYYFFNWDEEKGEAVGGLDFSLEGRDNKGQGFLCKPVFTDVYFQKNGLVVGSVNNTAAKKYSRIIETYEIDGICEIVIKPCIVGKSVAGVDMQVAVGGTTQVWDGDLSQYLVKEADGSVVYRIPLPLGSNVSDGSAIATKTVKSAFKIEQMLDAGYDKEEDPFEIPNEDITNNYDKDDNNSEDNSDANTIPGKPYEKMARMYFEDYIYELYANPEVLYMISFDGFNYNVGHAPYIDLSDAYAQGVPYNEITSLSTVDKTFEDYYEYCRTFGKNVYKEISSGEVSNITVAQYTVKYFTTTYTHYKANPNGNIKEDVINFYVDLGDGNSIQGSWNVFENQNRPITFEEFLNEAFGHMVKVYE